MGFYWLVAQQYYTTLVNAFANIQKWEWGVVVFRSLSANLSSISFGYLTSPFICARFVGQPAGLPKPSLKKDDTASTPNFYTQTALLQPLTFA